MNYHTFKEMKAKSHDSLTALKDFTRHLSANRHFLGRQEWSYLPKIRSQKNDISWICPFLELASPHQVEAMLMDYIAKRPRLQIDTESYVMRMVDVIQPQVPKFLLPLMFERILEVSQSFHSRPQADEKYLEVIEPELREVREVMNLLIVSERLFNDAEKILKQRFADA